MKKSEMDKLREFIEQAIQDGWRHVPMGLAQLLDTFEVDPPSAKETAEKNEMNIEPHEPEEAFYSEEVIEQIKAGIEDADAGRVLDIKSFVDKYGGTDIDLDPELEEAGIECLRGAEKDLKEDSAMYELLSHIELCKGISQMNTSKYKKPEEKNISEIFENVTWQQAIDKAKSLGEDWILPSKWQLYVVYRAYELGHPDLQDMKDKAFWSASAYDGYGGTVPWIVNFINGAVIYTSKTSLASARFIRKSFINELFTWIEEKT